MVKRAKRESAAGKTEPQINAVLERYFGLSQQGTRHPHRIRCRCDHFSDDGLHRLRQPDHSRQSRNGPRRGVRRHLRSRQQEGPLVMGLYANYPIALAPGWASTQFFAFTVVLTYKYTWQQVLAAVFCSGVLFFLISVFRIRQFVMNSIPAKSEACRIGGRRPVP